MDRTLQPELMDAPGLEKASHTHALRGLARLNSASLSVRSTWAAVRRLLESASFDSQQLSILDVASGGGDLAIGLSDRATRYGYRPIVDGLDVSETAVDFARAQVPARYHVKFHTVEVLQEHWPVPRADIVVSSLFLHHLPEEDAVRLLNKMAAHAGIGIVVNDLRRSVLGYGLAHVACRCLTRSAIVHSDGPQSVRSAYTVTEVRQLAVRAGLKRCSIVRVWPFRFILTWRR